MVEHPVTQPLMQAVLGRYTPEHFGAVLGRAQQFLTIHLYETEEPDEEVSSSRVYLAVVFIWDLTSACV